MTQSTTPRGSDALFAFGKDETVLAEALGAAREDYQVKWWWKYGQPKIDHVRADLEIRKENFGAAIARIMAANSDKLQVTAEVFPNGMPAVDSFRVKLDIRNPAG